MKLSLPWLWLLSFVWSACSWSCQSWEESRKGFWEALEARRPWRPQAPLDFLDFNCPPAAVTVLAFQLLADLEAGAGLSQDRLLQLEELLRHAFAFESLESLAAMLCSGFPVFGVLDWLAEILSDSVDGGLADCLGVRADQFHKALHHHVPPRPRGGRLSGPLPMPLPMAAALDFLLATRGQGGCGVGRAAATLALALAELRPVGGNETCQDLGLGSAAEAAQPASAALPLFTLLAKAQRLLLEEEGSLALRLLHRRWLPARLLHGLSRLLLPAWDSEQEPSEDCLILIYTFPTEEIRRDVRKALASLQSNYVEAKGERGFRVEELQNGPPFFGGLLLGQRLQATSAGGLRRRRQRAPAGSGSAALHELGDPSGPDPRDGASAPHALLQLPAGGVLRFRRCGDGASGGGPPREGEWDAVLVSHLPPHLALHCRAPLPPSRPRLVQAFPQDRKPKP